jgi:hypothetical protein
MSPKIGEAQSFQGATLCTSLFAMNASIDGIGTAYEGI